MSRANTLTSPTVRDFDRSDLHTALAAVSRRDDSCRCSSCFAVRTHMERRLTEFRESAGWVRP